jgi:hypothetical protein
MEVSSSPLVAIVEAVRVALDPALNVSVSRELAVIAPTVMAEVPTVEATPGSVTVRALESFAVKVPYTDAPTVETDVLTYSVTVSASASLTVIAVEPSKSWPFKVSDA